MLKLIGIGALGNMLSPAACHLNQEGSPAKFVGIFDHNPRRDYRVDRKEQWLAQGAKITSDWEQLLSLDFDGVMLCVGKNGDDLPLILRLIKDITHRFPQDHRPFILHCSTVSVEFVAYIDEQCTKAKIPYANYPLTGGAKGACEGTMLIIASGDQCLYQRVKPLLQKLGQPHYFDPDVTAGAKIKLISHVMVFNGLLGISSAIALQTKVLPNITISQTNFFDFLNQGAGGTRQWEVALKPAVALQNWHQGFLLPHATIDALYTADLLIKSGLPFISIFSILQLAAVFSYLLNNSEETLASQAVVRVLQDNSTDFQCFMNKKMDYNLQQFQQNIIDSLPASLQQKVLLNVVDYGEQY